MPSKYIGKIGEFELHAFTENGDYRDDALAGQMHKIRYRILQKGHAIYCTAVSPNFKKKEERNSHDALPSTTHFVVINNKTSIVEYCLSAAKDSGETCNGEVIGLPLENRYLSNGYPSEASLDTFRELFLRNNYQNDTDVPPNRIVEFYRHVKNPDSNLKGKHSMGARLGVYAAAYQYLVRDAIKEDRLPADLWVWDAIPKYANIYSYVCGVFRNFTIAGNGKLRWEPTKYSNLESKVFNNRKHYFLKDGTRVTRNLKILIPPRKNFGPENRGNVEVIPMIDGLVDVRYVEALIKNHPLIFPGEDVKFLSRQRALLGVVCHKMYLDHHGSKNEVKVINEMAQIETRTHPFEV